MKLLSNYLRNHEFIVDFCKNNPDKFINRKEEEGGHYGPLPVCSQFKSLKDEDMEDWFIDKIFEEADFDDDLKDFFSFIQIQKYDIGDYIVPHKDNYNIEKLHLVTLTSSEYDGLTYLTDDSNLIKIYDEAGRKIDADMNNHHWVDPVKELRFSLVIGV